MRWRAEREQGVGGPKVRGGGRLRPGPIGVEVVERGASHVRGGQERAAPDFCWGSSHILRKNYHSGKRGFFLYVTIRIHEYLPHYYICPHSTRSPQNFTYLVRFQNHFNPLPNPSPKKFHVSHAVLSGYLQTSGNKRARIYGITHHTTLA